MSLTQQPQTTYADDGRVSEEDFAHMRLTSDVAWYHPEEDAVYVSNDDRIPRFEPGQKVIPSVTKALEQKMLRRQGKLNADSIFNIYNPKDGWQDKVAEYISWKKRHGGRM